jgi:hypothetical protein
MENEKYLYPADFTSPYGIHLGDALYQIDGKIHFTHPQKPVVYEIDKENIYPVYELSLGDTHFPSLDYLKSISKNNTDYTRALIHSGYVASYSLLETSRFLLITCMVNQQIYIGLYEKQTGKSWKYSEKDFIDITHTDGINFPFVGTYNDSFIATVSPGRLKNRYVRNDALRNLSENISEEDNPILCIIKFN